MTAPTSTGRLPFEAIQAATLAQADRLLAEWFPSGKREGSEFKIGNIRGEPGRSLSIDLRTGLWKDFAGPESGGHDLIDLRAAMLHGGDRVAAARELGISLGMIDGPHLNGGAVHATINGSNHSSWEPVLPVPANAPPAPGTSFAGYDTVYDYRAPDDALLFYIRRREARGSSPKVFHPLVYGRLDGRLGWHHRHARAPRPLYGLNRLATMPDATVIVCEGEKAADAAQVLFPEHACVTWPGGAKAIAQADWHSLSGREVIIWPDADQAGREAARAIAKVLPRARVLRVDDLPEGWDAADVSLEDPGAWLHSRLPDDPAPALRQYLAIEAWADRDIPEPDRLLGHLLTTTSRMFIVGRTGLGKTMFGFALACGIASGQGFLHWRCVRPVRVLYVDGEMAAELIKARAIDALRRGVTPPPGNLVIYAKDYEEEFARLFPTIGSFAPLNTEQGHNFILALIAALGGVDLVIFDNVMALVAGDHKDEIPWNDTLPLISTLTAKRVGQIWIDHTGHNSDRQYGSATKAWRFDTVAIMAPLSDDQGDRRGLAFTLSFDPPGKARRRTPENWADFETATIRLQNDRWTSEVADRPKVAEGSIPPAAKAFYRALLDALAVSSTPGSTTRQAWLAECERLGLSPETDADDTHAQRERKRKLFRTYMSRLKVAGWIGVDGETVRALVSESPP